MKVGDINFQDATIQINADISKNKKTEIVTIPDELMEIFIEQKIFDYPDHYYLFGVGGTPSLRRRKKNYFQTAHLAILRYLKFDTKKYKLYSWKHTGVRNLIRLKVPLKFIQMQGRWHDLDQLNQYVRLMGIEDMTEIKERHTLWVNK